MVDQQPPSLESYGRSVIGKLPAHWRYMRLGDLEREGAIVQIQDGNHGEKHPKSSDYVPSGIPFVMAKDIRNNRLDLKNCSFITEQQARSLRIGFAKPGDVLLTHKATMGRVAIVPNVNPFVMLTPQVTYYRLGESGRLLNSYLKYAFLSPPFQHQLQSDSDQSTRQYIGITAQRQLWLPVAPIEEQRAIAAILDSLEDKIEVNRCTNETLEAMARTLFRSWFVDFDPVRAKSDGRPPEGVDAKTAKLFPASFEDSTLGSIPKGWRVAPIGEFVEIARGLSYKGEGLAETGVALHNLNSVYEGGGYKHEGLKHYLGDYKDCHQVRPGDLIVTNTEQGHDHLLIGYSALVPKRYGSFGLFSHHLYRVSPLPGSPLTPPFVHHLLLTSRFRGEVIGYTNGTTVNMLASDGLKRPTFALPPPDLIRRFTDIVTPLLDRAEANYDESRTLAATRDALLPKLLSGEVKVGDAASTLVGKA